MPAVNTPPSFELDEAQSESLKYTQAGLQIALRANGTNGNGTITYVIQVRNPNGQYSWQRSNWYTLTAPLLAEMDEFGILDGFHRFTVLCYRKQESSFSL